MNPAPHMSYAIQTFRKVVSIPLTTGDPGFPGWVVLYQCPECAATVRQDDAQFHFDVHKVANLPGGDT